MLQRQQMELQGQRAFGQIYARHVTPDGVDVPGILSEAAKDPAASLVLPEYTGTALQQRGQMIANATNQLGLFGAQYKPVLDYLSSLDPDSKTLPEDVRNGAVTLKRLMPSLPGATVAGITHLILDDPQGPQHGVLNARNIAMGPAAISAPTVGTPTAGGAPQRTTMGQANIAGGTFPIGLAPGEEPLIAAPATRAAALQATASTTGQYHADLENLRRDSQILGQVSGVSVEAEKKLNATLQRFGVPGLTLTPDQVGAAESFDKITNLISANQAQFLGAATDAGRNMIVGATPSLSQSQFGREGIIDMLQGNQDAVDRMRQLWFAARKKGAAAGSYDDFVNNLVTPADQNVPAFDPRVFQFNRMNRANQQKFLNGMSPEQVADFERRYRYAIEQKWVKPLTKQNAPIAE